MKITIINGANLNLLGKREPEIYGNISFETFFEQLKKEFSDIEFDCFQSNIEGEIVNFIQQAGETSNGIVLNAGGYSHTSVVIADAVKAVAKPCIEVHISNIFSREPERHVSLISKYATGVIAGLGLNSYRLAVQWLVVSDF
ncbi:MAG: 3-dehydroquinate dehydratase [Prevotellaceae bacterium]|jgi:3-dehydroquinate dehydratase-2|nr:3-dehydroquinate dehydratase [Prevotellaceae bacterium]